MLLKIEKLIYGGDGLARLPTRPTEDDRGRGKAVFIPFVLAGEKIEAALTEEKAGFARAYAGTIIESSAYRIDPACLYYARCGGCLYQHAAYDHQLEIKKGILRENLRRIAKIELDCDIQVHRSPPWNYRNRSRLQVRTQPEFAMGYFKFASHEVLPVEQCPISSPLINRAIAALWQSGRGGKVVDGVREVEFFANSDADGNESQLLLELLCAPEARRAAVRAWAEELCASMPEIVGIVAFREPQKGVQEPLVYVGVSELTYKTRSAAYRVSAGAFFQTNRFLTDELVRIVTAGQSGDMALDLYAGVGLFSTALASDFRHTVSVEMSHTAFSDLQYNLPANGKAVHSGTEQYLGVARSGTAPVGAGKSSIRADRDAEKGRVRREALPQQLLQKPDLIVVDPPRSGLGESASGALASLGAPRLTYVSCDPATLARDLVPLRVGGYSIEEMHLVDLFPQTYHLEAIVHLVR